MTEWVPIALGLFGVIQAAGLWIATRGLNRINRMGEDVRQMDGRVGRLEEWRVGHDKQDDEREHRHEGAHADLWRALDHDWPPHRRRTGE